MDLIEYIESHLESDLSLEFLASLAGYSPYHLSVIFRKRYGETLKSYLQKRRLTLAAESLMSTDHRIIDIAIQYGYTSQEAFSRAFLGRYGITPRRFRHLKRPVQSKHPKVYSQNEEVETMSTHTILKLQQHFKSIAPTKIMNVLNGQYMLKRFEEESLIDVEAQYVPFNEAMCWGTPGIQPFDETFISVRAAALNSTSSQYEEIVVNPLSPMLALDYDILVLWFGDDMFCQVNYVTLMAYLDAQNYQGEVFLCLADEQQDAFLDKAIPVDPHGYLEIYHQVMLERKMPRTCPLPVTYQALKLYLTYDAPDSPIVKYIQENHITTSQLEALFHLFPEYGLGDLQYKALINQYGSI